MHRFGKASFPVCYPAIQAAPFRLGKAQNNSGEGRPKNTVDTSVYVNEKNHGLRVRGSWSS